MSGRPLAAMLAVTWSGIALLVLFGDEAPRRARSQHAPSLQTGVRDARTWTPAMLDRCAAELDGAAATDAFVEDVAARTAPARAAVSRWTASSGEWIARAGWSLLARLVAAGEPFSRAELAAFVETIQQNVHKAPAGTRAAMRDALRAIRARSGIGN